ncbi:MAG TPA: HAD family phosphatase [Steroidobacteraceae bacterium]|nr:HAD family phosphatase [Steroidobacteraceae bacterium]
MPIRNVVFDVGGVLLRWDPPAFIATVVPDPAQQALVLREIFQHPEWHEFDRGSIDVDRAVTQFGQRAGLSPEQMRRLLQTANASLHPVPGSIELVEDLAAAGVHLYVLSNMPVSTYEYLVKAHGFFAHFKQLVISGAILLIKPEPAIYKHLVERTGIVPAESVFIDDLLKNVVAARESGLHAIQFESADTTRAALRAYLPGANL